MKSFLKLFQEHKQSFYFSGMALMAIGLPVSEFLMSVSFIVLAFAWLINGPKKIQWNAFKNNKLAWLSASIFIITLLGLLNTSNYPYALAELRIKIPLLLVPVFVAYSNINVKNQKIILALFVGSTFVGTLICFTNYQVNLKYDLVNIRDISIFISHIRFSLLIDFAIFILVYYAIKNRNRWSVVMVVMAVWLTYFLFFLSSGNGILVFVLLMIIGFITLILKSPYPKLGLGFGIVILFFLFYLGNLSYTSYKSHFFPKNEAYNLSGNIHKRTVNHNTTYSKPNNYQLENGYYIWRNISNKELEKEWMARANPAYFYKDIKGQGINGTLSRYLTSKGLSKDSVGVWQLNDLDIQNIEKGNYSYLQSDWNHLELRVDQFFFQLNSFYRGKNPSNKPFIQRIYYLKGAFAIIKDNFITGVGTGDIQDNYYDYFNREHPEILEEFRHHTHNQYLTIFITLGVFGFVWFVFAVFYPLFFFIKRDYLLAIGQFILLVSFLTEDTLETQPGATFYVFIVAMGVIRFQNKNTDE